MVAHFPPTTLQGLSGPSLHPDVYIFLHVLLPPSLLRSAWWISSLSEPLSPLSFSFSCLAPALSLSFMAYFCAATQALAKGWLVGWLVGSGGMGGGWFARFQANWNIHVCVPVSLCASAFTCTPPQSLYTYVGLFMSVVWSGQLLVKSPGFWYVCISARVSVRLHFILFIFFARWCVKPCRLI